MEWREPRLDLAELAKLRWIEGLSRKVLAERYGRTEEAIQNCFQALKRKSFEVPGLLGARTTGAFMGIKKVVLAVIAVVMLAAAFGPGY